MKPGKSKALEAELVDELLDDDELSELQSQSDSYESIISEEESSSATSQQRDTSLYILDLDDSDELPTSHSMDGEDEERAEVPPFEVEEDEAPTHVRVDIDADEVSSTVKVGEASKTMAIDEELSLPSNPSFEPEKETSSIQKLMATAKSVVSGNAFQSTLAQSENLKIAQNRILDLEKEVERLRLQNEELAAAGETLRRRSEELSAREEHLSYQLQQSKETHEQERGLLQQSLSSKSKELERLRLKIEEMEMRLSTNIQKIRVRERELENRLELVRMEGQAVVRSKDEFILELKRQMDQLNMEAENFRQKGQDLNRQMVAKQDLLRRTVKALRITLSMLEGDEEAAPPLKKVD